MIYYARLWKTLKKKNISQYKQIKDYGIDNAQLHRLRNNIVVKTVILDTLCRILDCKLKILWNTSQTKKCKIYLLRLFNKKWTSDFCRKSISILFEVNYFRLSSTATATETVMPTMGLLPGA